MLRLALYQPDIPQNTGTMLRMAACLGLAVEIVEPAGFDVSDRHLRRSGLDYLDHVAITRHRSFAAFAAWRAEAGIRLVLATTAGAVPYTDFAFRPDDCLMVGRESAGVPEAVRGRLFEPFVTGRPDGTGLGLAIVREIARAHGGQARLGAPPPRRTGTEATGPGATFELDLPWPAQSPVPRAPAS